MQSLTELIHLQNFAHPAFSAVNEWRETQATRGTP